ncbi:MAG TPA: hypothetical protein VK619_15710 [Pyrinomonadaceae bacterium]|nr:hypothetical protein [Pyrinomonadaceae bacterium]
MKRSSIYGIALIFGSLGMVVTMLFHPTGHDLLAQADQLARRNEMIAVVTHSLALASIPVLFFGFLGLSKRLGWDHALVPAALVAYGFGAVAAMCAAVFSGLVAPVLTRQMLTADDSTQQVLDAVFHHNGLLNQGFAKVFVVASSLAIVFWSVSILRIGSFARAAGLVGCFVGLVGLAGILSGHLRLDVHGFALFIFAQSVWTILIGVLLCRPGDSLEAA